jgi:hypothetical protein
MLSKQIAFVMYSLLLIEQLKGVVTSDSKARYE